MTGNQILVVTVLVLEKCNAWKFVPACVTAIMLCTFKNVTVLLVKSVPEAIINYMQKITPKNIIINYD